MAARYLEHGVLRLSVLGSLGAWHADVPVERRLAACARPDGAIGMLWRARWRHRHAGNPGATSMGFQRYFGVWTLYCAP